MAIPFIDLSNAVKWFSGFGSGAPGDPYGLTVGLGRRRERLGMTERREYDEATKGVDNA